METNLLFVAKSASVESVPLSNEHESLFSKLLSGCRGIKAFALMFLVIFGVDASAQFTISGAAPATNGTYTSLTGAGGAFAALNGTAQTSNNIVVTVTASSTTLEDGSVALGAGAWTSLRIVPVAGAWTISGDISGAALITLNGSDNVTIDGINSGGVSLTIDNLNAGSTNSTATIKIDNDATNNTITNCTILGGYSPADITTGTTFGGTIWFGLNGPSTGNDVNTISNCNIGNTAAGLPAVAIFSLGNVTTAAQANSSITIRNNNIYNYFQKSSAATRSAGVYCGSGTKTWTIDGNRFYQTATRTFTASDVQHSPIWCNSNAATSGNEAMTITNNIIGYASSTQTGTYTLDGGNTTGGKFIAIYFTGRPASGTVTSTISNNTIQAVSFTNTQSSGTGITSPFAGIIMNFSATGTTTNTHNNIIGSQTATGSLTYTKVTNTTTSEVHGISRLGGNGTTWNALGNQIGGITMGYASSTGGRIDFIGMKCALAASGGTFTATSNIIGGSVANSIQLNNSSSTSSRMVGFQSDNSANNGGTANNLQGNTIRNFALSSTCNPSGNGTSAGMAGIIVNTTGAQTIRNNTIYNLSSAGTSNFNSWSLFGIHAGIGTGNSTIDGNFIYKLTSAHGSTNGAANLYGIYIVAVGTPSGTHTFSNNMISLPDAQATRVIPVGIYNALVDVAGTWNIYHNSVYIGGSTSGTVNTSPVSSAAYYSTMNTATALGTELIQNNIFQNERTLGTGAVHVIINIGANTSRTTLNNNIYSRAAGVTPAGFQARVATTGYTTFATWKSTGVPATTGADAASIEGAPTFKAPTATTPDLHITYNGTSWIGNATGANLSATVSTDFDGLTRSGFTPHDIGAAVWVTGATPDATKPTITYTALGNQTCGTQPISLTVSPISDAGSGIRTSGLQAPIMYYKINSGSYNAVPLEWTSGTAYKVTFPAVPVFVAGDVISYYIMAQDGSWLTTNVQVGPSSTGAATYTVNPPSVFTPPTSPSTFTISAPPAVVAGGPNTVSMSSSPTAITLSGSSVTGGTAKWTIFSLTPTNGNDNGVLSVYAETPSPQSVTYTPPANYSGTVILRLISTTTGGCVSTTDRTINITTPACVAPTVTNNTTVTTGTPTTTTIPSITINTTYISGQDGYLVTTNPNGLYCSSACAASLDGTSPAVASTFGTPANFVQTVQYLGTSSSGITASSGLQSNTSYVINVYPYQNVGCSGGPKYYKGMAQTAGSALTCTGPPQTLSGAATGNTTADITFTAPSGTGTITAYALQYSVAGANSWTTASPAPTSSPYNLTGLTANTVYDIRMTATNATCTSTYITTSSAFTTPSGCANAAITNATAGSSYLCSGATTSLTANGVGGTNAVLTWWTGSGGTGTNLGSSNPLTLQGAGTYYARVTADCGSPVEAMVTVGSKTNVSITSVTPAASPICPSATTSITAVFAGTNASLRWWGGAGGTGTDYGTSNPLTGVGPGTYYARVTGDCGGPVETSVTISAKTNVSITSVTPVASSLCLTATTDITAVFVGTNASLNWWGSAGGTGTNYGTSNPLTGVGPGTYYARITGDCGGPVETLTTISTKTNVSIISATAGVNPICSGTTTSITANGVAGTGATLTWWTGSGGTGTNLGSSNPLTSQGAGTYYARVTGDCGGPVEASVTVTSNPTPSAPTGTSPQVFCSAYSPTVADLAATGTGIQWYSASSGGSALLTSTALVDATHYYATQTVSGCESSSRLDVLTTVNVHTGGALATIGTSTSSGNTTNGTPLTAIGGGANRCNRSSTIYSKAILNQVGGFPSSGSQTINSIGWMASSAVSITGTVKIYMENTSATTTTTSADWSTQIINSATQVYNGSVSFNTVDGQYSTITLTTPFVWDNTNNLRIAVEFLNSGTTVPTWYKTTGGNTASSANFSNVCAATLSNESNSYYPNTQFGTRQLVVTPSALTGINYCAGSGPSASQSFTISGTNLACSGNVTITGSTNFEVSIDNSAFSGSITVSYVNGSITGQPKTIYVRLKSGLNAGNYNTETISASGGGAAAVNVISSGTVNSCAPLAYNVNYTSGASTISTSGNAVTVCPGITSIGIDNAEANITYKLYESGNATSVSTITPSSSGAFNFSYTPQAGKTYTVTGTNAILAVTNMNGSVIINPALSFTETHTPVLCNGGSSGTITVSATGGTGAYTYSKDNVSNYQVNNVFNSLALGTYPIRVKDVNDCIAGPTNVSITQPSAALSFSSSSVNVDCNGNNNGTIILDGSGGTTPYSYTNNNGSNYISGSDPYTFTAVSPATYDVGVKDANNCLTVITQVTITEPQVLGFTTSQVDVLCHGANTGSITVSATGGFGTIQYSKNGGTNYQSSNVFSGLIAGTYQIKIKDAHLCVTSQAIVINQPSTLPTFTSVPLHILCNGDNTGSITVIATNGNPGYTYSSDNGSNYQSSNVFGSLGAGIYVVKIKDANLCTTASQNVQITEPTLVTYTASKTNVVCNAANDGTITINGNGGVAPYQYSINNGTSFSPGIDPFTFNNLAPGVYLAGLKDANDCVKGYTTITITTPTAVTFTTTQVNVLCFGGNNASITVNASGGTGTLTYSNNNGISYQLSNMFNALVSGTYQIKVKDANGCVTAAQSVTITQPPAALTVTASNGSPYSTTVTASLFSTPAGGTTPYNYAWSGPGFTSTLRNPTRAFTLVTMTGTYTVTVTDANGCTATASTVMNVYDGYVWTGAVSGDWANNGNWSFQVPDYPDDCTQRSYIQAGTPFSPTVNIPGLTVGNITLVNGAVLTLANDITLCGNLTGSSTTLYSGVAGPGKLIMKSTPSVLQTISGKTRFVAPLRIDNTAGVRVIGGNLQVVNALELKTGVLTVNNSTLMTFISTSSSQCAIIDNFSAGMTGSISGAVVMQRKYDAPTAPFYKTQHYMGSPVDQPLLTQFGANGTPGYIINTTCNERASSPGSPFGDVAQYDEDHGAACTLQGWKIMNAGSAANGRGYSVSKNGAGTLYLTGVPNQATSYVRTGLTNSNWTNTTLQGYTDVSGWHMMSNPWLANLRITTNGGAGFDNQVAVWQTTGGFAGTYAYYQVGFDNVDIAPFQAFFIHKTSPGGTATYTINGSDRVRTPATMQFQSLTNDHELSVYVDNNSNGLRDKTIVAFNASATDGFDPIYDGNKLGGDPDRLSLYSMNNSLQMARNTLASINNTSTVDMGFDAGTSGTFTMSFDGLNSFDPTSYIMLEDKKTNTMYNVRNGNYTFIGDTADSKSRFVLHFTPAAEIAQTDATCSTTGTISVTQPGTANWNYTVTDNSNITVASGLLNQTTPIAVNANPGVYTITLVDNNNYTVAKQVQVTGMQQVVASFNTTATTVQQDDDVTFTATSTNATNHLWNFGDNSSATGNIITHSYTTPGVYTAKLTSDNNDCQSISTQQITVTAKMTTGISNITDKKGITIWSSENTVYVDMSREPKVEAQIEIYNVLGQQLSIEKFGRSSIYSKQFTNLEAAYVIVRVKNNEEITTKKVFVVNNK